MSNQRSLSFLELKKKELELLKAQKAYEGDLPHLFGAKFYPWARTFHDSVNRVNLLCAANQISKSSTAIRRCISNATDPERWKLMYQKKPKMFWYFYPDADTLKREWVTKWEGEWLPQGEQKDSDQYGWKIQKIRTIPSVLTFNTGVSVFFMFYTKKLEAVQAGTVDEIFVDEELPVNFLDELTLRLTRTNGIFTACFTPTLNQPFWKRAIETKEHFPEALKLQVSMYDCLEYEDGSPSTFFTREKIREIELKCTSQTEIDRRVHGKFVTEVDRTYFAFDYDKHFVPPVSIKSYNVYAALDYGSGKKSSGEGSGHPAAISYIAVRPDGKKGYVFRAWRGDKEETTAGDVVNKHVALSKDLVIVQAVYDHGSKDMKVIADRMGISLMPANKSRDEGVKLVNTLLRYRMLEFFDDDPEVAKFAEELSHLMNFKDVSSKYGDDLADTLRYNCMSIPWDFQAIAELEQIEQDMKTNKINEEPEKKARPLTEEELIADQIRQRRGEGEYKDENEWKEFDEEFDYWNEQY